jgi:hypothetical protein
MDPTIARALPYVIPLVILVFVLRRNLRGRNLRVERLWIYPAVLVLITGAILIGEPAPSALTVLALPMVLALGGIVGWYRGRLTEITIHPHTHEFTSRASVAGTFLIGAVFAARYGLRLALADRGAGLPIGLDVTQITDGLMLFAIGLMSVQRIEMYLRCRKLLDQARGGRANG